MEEKQEPGPYGRAFSLPSRRAYLVLPDGDTGAEKGNPIGRHHGFPMAMCLRSDRGGFLGAVSVDKAEAVPFSVRCPAVSYPDRRPNNSPI